MKVALKEFNRIAWSINGVYHDMCTKLGISDSEFDILYVLCEQGEGCNQSALYKNSCQKKSTINTALKKLEKNGYLFLEKGVGRNTRVFLTDEGRKLSDNTVKRVIEIENNLFEKMTKEEQEAMIHLNQKYLDGLINGSKLLFDGKD